MRENVRSAQSLKGYTVFEILTQRFQLAHLLWKKIIPNHIGKLLVLSVVNEQFITNHQHFISQENSESHPKYHWTTPRLPQILNEIFMGSFEILLLTFKAFIVSLSPNSFTDSYESTLIIFFVIAGHTGNEDSLCTWFIKCVFP